MFGCSSDLEIRIVGYCFRSTISMRTGPQFNPERDFTKVIGTAGDGGKFALIGDWWGALYLTITSISMGRSLTLLKIPLLRAIFLHL